MPVSRSQIQFVRSLERKRVRDEEGVFLAEGPRMIQDLSYSLECVFLAATGDFLDTHHIPSRETVQVSRQELERMSLLCSPQNALAVFRKPEAESVKTEDVRGQLLLALDCVQDPGNLGTIIRLADWFGIRRIIASPDTADAFAPKTVQATMGAISRVRVEYRELAGFIGSLPPDFAVYTTELEGECIYSVPLSPEGVIVMGNEGQGVSQEVRRLATRRLLIPSYPAGAHTSESLNVGIATAITLSEFRRRSV